MGPADGAGVPPAHQHPAALGAGAQVLAGAEDAAPAPVHADHALGVHGGGAPVGWGGGEGFTFFATFVQSRQKEKVSKPYEIARIPYETQSDTLSMIRA